jgi:serine/threonine protein kinase
MSHRFNEELDKKIDVYAYGCILYEVFAREKMWNGYKLGEIVAAVRNGVRPALGSRFESAPPLLVDIMKRCWRQKPADRPSFLEIKLIITNAFIDGASSNSNTNSKSNTLAEFTSDFSHTI